MPPADTHERHIGIAEPARSGYPRTAPPDAVTDSNLCVSGFHAARIVLMRCVAGLRNPAARASRLAGNNSDPRRRGHTPVLCVAPDERHPSQRHATAKNTTPKIVSAKAMNTKNRMLLQTLASSLSSTSSIFILRRPLRGLTCSVQYARCQRVTRAPVKSTASMGIRRYRRVGNGSTGQGRAGHIAASRASWGIAQYFSQLCR